MNINPYKILNVQKDFTLDELKEKYKTLALQTHPDKGGNNQLFILVTKCFKYLYEDYQNKKNKKEFVELREDFHKWNERQTDNEANEKKIYDTFMKNKFDTDKFNKFFEENKFENKTDKGYGEWMNTTAEAITDTPAFKKKFNNSSFNDHFEKHVSIEKNNKFVVKYKEPEPLFISKKINFTDLVEEECDDYSGDNTSHKKLNFMDYKLAHTTSRIVNKNTTSNKSYKNIDDIERERANVKFTMNDKELKRYHKKLEKEKQVENERERKLREKDERIQEFYARLNAKLLHM